MNISIETNRVSCVINPNKYEKYNYYDILNNCNHLMVIPKLALANLFKKYKNVFSGKLGEVPCPPIELKLKKAYNHFVLLHILFHKFI